MATENLLFFPVYSAVLHKLWQETKEKCMSTTLAQIIVKVAAKLFSVHSSQMRRAAANKI